MLSIDCGVDTIITKRRCLNEIIIYTKIARKAFGDLSIKEPSRPALTYYYNMDINGVNRGN